MKNRYHALEPKNLDPRVTLAAMLERCDDENRWDSSRAAEVTGYVHDVKVGGIESANCHARDASNGTRISSSFWVPGRVRRPNALSWR